MTAASFTELLFDIKLSTGLKNNITTNHKFRPPGGIFEHNWVYSLMGNKHSRLISTDTHVHIVSYKWHSLLIFSFNFHFLSPFMAVQPFFLFCKISAANL